MDTILEYGPVKLTSDGKWYMVVLNGQDHTETDSKEKALEVFYELVGKTIG